MKQRSGLVKALVALCYKIADGNLACGIQRYNDAIDKMDTQLKGLHESIQKIQQDSAKRESWDEPKREIQAFLDAVRDAYNRL